MVRAFGEHYKDNPQVAAVAINTGVEDGHVGIEAEVRLLDADGDVSAAAGVGQNGANWNHWVGNSRTIASNSATTSVMMRLISSIESTASFVLC